MLIAGCALHFVQLWDLPDVRGLKMGKAIQGLLQ